MLAAVVMSGSLLTIPTAHAAPANDGRLPAAKPTLGTPHVMNGEVTGIAQVGNTIFAVGSFTRVSPANTFKWKGDDLDRKGIFAFDATTGEIDESFDVRLGGTASAIDTDGQYLYVGGGFVTVNGQKSIKRVVKLTTNGNVAGAFRAAPDAVVNSLVVRGQRVYIGGTFTRISSHGRKPPRRALAALDAKTGRVLPSVNLPFKGTFRGFGRTSIRGMDVSDNGKRLVAAGNFSRSGKKHRVQVAVLDTSGGRAKVTRWHTNRFDSRHNACLSKFDSMIKDVDVAPNGSYFVVATTGGFAGGARARSLCDTTSRWSTKKGNRPAWVAYTGGDTTTGVQITNGAVYVGGHMRWENNPLGNNHRGPGAVPREGIAALDPVTGVPLSWNPGRQRGVGAAAFLATSDGLWVGSDTTLFNNQRRGRIAFLPWAGGKPIPRSRTASLPNDLFLAPQRGNGELRERPVSGGGAPTGPSQQVSTNLDWRKVRGAFYSDGYLYYAWAQGGLYRRTFDPDTGALGAKRKIALWAVQFPTKKLTGMFYEPVRHRLYYSVAGDRNLYYRDFFVESNILGGQLNVAKRHGIDFRKVAGMTLADGRLLYGSSDGKLRSVGFRNGGVTGKSKVVSRDGSWRTRGLFVPND